MARIKVRATKDGFYGLRFRRPGQRGDVFYIKSEKDFSKKWMEKVVSKKPKEPKEPDTETEADSGEKEKAEASSEESGSATGDQRVI